MDVRKTEYKSQREPEKIDASPVFPEIGISEA
jgi:hypothetical protein